MYTLVAGDLKPDLPISVFDPDTQPADLADATTIELQWRKPDGTELHVELDTVNVGLGQLVKIWDEGETDIVGFHRGRVVIDRDMPTQEHYPNDGSWLIWQVSQPE